MNLTSDDLQAIGKVVDERLDAKLEEKLESKLEVKLAPIYEFIDFAKTALLSLLDESQEHFEQKLPPLGSHAS